MGVESANFNYLKEATGLTDGNLSANLYKLEVNNLIKIEKKLAIEDELFMQITELGAENFLVEDDFYIIITKPQELHKIKNKINLKSEATLEMIPKVLIECSDEDIDLNIKLIEFLENLDDVDAVYHNMKI